jgi:hypothetical protein
MLGNLEKWRNLAVQIMYSRKGSGTLATPIAEQASINTPETSRGTGSAN